MRKSFKTFVIALGAVSLGSCSMGDFGDYGVVSASTHYGSGNYYPHRDHYGYGTGYRDAVRYGIPVYYGWYDGLYYPGYGIYVYDRGGKRHGWRPHHRRYWESRHAEFRRWRMHNPRVDLHRIDRRLDRLERDDRGYRWGGKRERRERWDQDDRRDRYDRDRWETRNDRRDRRRADAGSDRDRRSRDDAERRRAANVQAAGDSGAQRIERRLTRGERLALPSSRTVERRSSSSVSRPRASNPPKRERQARTQSPQQQRPVAQRNRAERVEALNRAKEERRNSLRNADMGRVNPR